MREFFNHIFHAAPAPQGRVDAARALARFAVLGAFVLGFVPGGRAALAQAGKNGGVAADAGVKKTAKTETPKAGAEKTRTESGKVNVKPIKAFLARSRR